MAERPSSNVESFAENTLLSVKLDIIVGFDLAEEEADVVAISMPSFEVCSRLESTAVTRGVAVSVACKHVDTELTYLKSTSRRNVILTCFCQYKNI